MDLLGPAVEAIHLAFRIGAAVGRYSSDSQRMDIDEGCWSMTVVGSAEAIESELQLCQDEMVRPNGFFNML